MKMYFRTQDLKRLELLDEDQLYILNRELIQTVSEIKSVIFVNENLVCELVSLAETSAKEIACRNRWSPRQTDGKYSTTGITYDTPEYREWLRDHRRSTVICDVDFLSQFSFWNDFQKLRTNSQNRTKK